MKIAIISNLYPPYGRGGAEIVITRIVTELLAEGHEVFVMTSRPFKGLRSLWPRLEDVANEMIYRFYPLNLYHPLRDFKHPKIIRLLSHIIDMMNPLNGLFVRKWIHDVAPDVIWTHNLKGIGLTIPFFLRTLQIPVVHHVHDVQLAIPSGLMLAGLERPYFPKRFLQRVYALVCILLIGSPAVVISPSQFLKNFYTHRGFFKKSQVMVLPNPAPKIETLPRNTRPLGPLRLLVAGQLEDHKGIRFLIESLKAFDVPFELTLAGDGSLRTFVSALRLEDRRFTYVGFLALDQLLKAFQVADALIVPSLCYENSPTIIYEALEAGLPVVASDIGGVAELVHQGTNGFLFTPGNRDELFSVLRTLNTEKDRLRVNAPAIRATVADLAIERYVEKLVALFASLT